MEFLMNGVLWTVRYVSPDDPVLIDRTNSRTCAVTDPATRSICLSKELRGSFLTTVVLHELGHVMLYSYGYLDDIHRMCKKRYWIEMEEFICNLIADRAREIFVRAYEIVGDEAIHFVPIYLERMVA